MRKGVTFDEVLEMRMLVLAGLPLAQAGGQVTCRG